MQTAYALTSLMEPANLAEVTSLHAAVCAIESEAMQLCRGLTEEQLAWRPAPDRWSIAENLAHMRATAEVFLPSVDATLASLRQQNRPCKKRSRLGLYGKLLVWSMEGRPVIRMRAPQAIQPRNIDSPALELELFLRSQAALKQRIAEAEDLDLTAFRFPSPLVRCLRVNLLEFFSTFNAHSRRHLRQATQIRHKML